MPIVTSTTPLEITLPKGKVFNITTNVDVLVLGYVGQKLLYRNRVSSNTVIGDFKLSVRMIITVTSGSCDVTESDRPARPQTTDNQSNIDYVDDNIFDVIATFVTDASGNPLADKFDYNPIGFNFYGLAWEQTQQTSLPQATKDLREAERLAMLQYAKDCDANLIRFALPVFQLNQFLLTVHNTATMPNIVTNANLRPEFIESVDTSMNELAQFGLKCMACLAWTQALAPLAFNEDIIESYANLNSQNAVYTKSFFEWFTLRYKDHPAFGIISIGNEYRYAGGGSGGDDNNATSTQLGNYFKFIADAVRKIRPGTLVTSDLQAPQQAVLSTKIQLDEFFGHIKNLTHGLDIINLHVYSTYNFTGLNVSDNAAYANLASANIGFEGVKSLLSTARAFSDAQNKKLIIGEFGVPYSAESAENSYKKAYFSSICASYADVSLVWNLQNATVAPTAGSGEGNQSNWFIDSINPVSPIWKTICQNLNKVKPNLPLVGAGVNSLRLIKKPQFSMGSSRVAGRVVSVTSTSAHQSTTGYSLAFWLKLKEPLTNFENIIKFTPVVNTSGILVLNASSAVSTAQIFSEGRRSEGGAGNNNGQLPVLPLNEWNHFAVIHGIINGVPTIQMWLNGIYWRSVTSTALPTSIALDSPLIALGNTSGAPVELQDVALMPFLDNEGVWAHLEGQILPTALLHLRAYSNGSILDISRNRLPVTIGAGVTVQTT